MKSLKLFLVCAVAVSGFTPGFVQSAQQGSKRTFWQKHKGKIKAGVALAALIGATIGLVYHGNKTKKAVEAAGVSDEKFGSAVAIVGALGPVGPDNAIKFFEWGMSTDDPFSSQGEKVLRHDWLVSFATNGIFNALAHYYYPESKADRVTFLRRLGTAIGLVLVRQVVQAVKEVTVEALRELQQAANGAKAAAGRFFAKKSK